MPKGPDTANVMLPVALHPIRALTIVEASASCPENSWVIALSAVHYTQATYFITSSQANSSLLHCILYGLRHGLCSTGTHSDPAPQIS